MLRHNMCTEDGLVNGAMGTIVGYDWLAGQRTGEEQPCGLSILFDNPRVGRLTRGTDEHLPTLLRLIPGSKADMAGYSLSVTSTLSHSHGQ